MSGWRDIEGLDGYQITRGGEVRSLGCIDARGIHHKPQVMKPYLMVNGYMAVTIKGQPRYVHRMLAMAFILNPSNKPHVNHIDGNKQNNSLSNLEWCTHQENMAHAGKMGVLNRPNLGKGEKCPAAKLTEKMVIEIKQLLARGFSQTMIAKQYGVNKSTVRWIKIGRTWSHI